jgi:hypothetical protein
MLARRISSSSSVLSSHTEDDGPVDNTRVRFNPHTSPSEWYTITERILQADVGTLTGVNVKRAEEAIRWWVICHTEDDAGAVDAAFRLVDRVTLEVSHNDGYLLTTPELRHWYTGSYPRATHLLNDVLSAWMRCWKYPVFNDEVRIFSPSEILLVVEGLATAGVPVDCRSYSLLMKASLYHEGANCDPAPLFCDKVLCRMIERGSEHSECLPDVVAFSTAINAWAKSTLPDAAQKALDLFREIVQLYDDRVLDEPPNTVTYAGVLEALVKAEKWDEMEIAETLLVEMNDSPYAGVSPCAVCYGIVLYGWVNFARSLGVRNRHPLGRQAGDAVELAPLGRQSRDAVDRAYRLLQQAILMNKSLVQQRLVDTSICSKVVSAAVHTILHPADYAKVEEMVETLFGQNSEFEPDLRTCRTLIFLYAKTRRPQQAQALLEYVENEATANNEASALPRLSLYRDVIKCWIEMGLESQDEEASIHVKKVVMQLFDLTKRCGKMYIPERELVYEALNFISKSRGIDAAKHATDLFRHLIHLHDDGFLDWAPNKELYNMILETLVKTEKWEEMEMAEQLLVYMMGSPYPDNSPSRGSFRHVIFGWADIAMSIRSQGLSGEDMDRTREAVERAYRLLQQASLLNQSNKSKKRPLIDASFCSHVVWVAVQTCTKPEHFLKAESMFETLYGVKFDQSQFKLDQKICQAMIMLYSRSERLRQAQFLLDFMETQATGKSKTLILLPYYRAIIMCWIRKGSSSDNDRPLHHVEDLVMRLLAWTKRPGGEMHIPGAALMDEVFKFIGSSSREDAAPRTEALFRMLQRTYEETKYIGLAPERTNFLQVMIAWSQSSAVDAASRCESLLNEMEALSKNGETNLMPTRSHYAAVIIALSKNGDSDVVARCRCVFQKACDDYARGNNDARPHDALYDAYLKACSLSGDGVTAELVFRSMIDDHGGGNMLAMPSVGSLNMVLQSLLRSNDPEAPRRVDSVLAFVKQKTNIQLDGRSENLLREIMSRTRPMKLD